MAASLSRSLVFVGFMGAGKSSATREVARALGLSARDSDELLQARLGEPIESFFDREGEAAFRAREEEVVLELLDPGAPAAVISLGGGALGSPRARAALAPHVAVLIEIELELAWSRAAGRGRPLARDRGRFDALYAEREATYRDVADATLPSSDRALVRRALPFLTDMAAVSAVPRMLWATATSGDYPVWVGPDAIATAPWPLAPQSRRIAVTDANVAELHAARIDPLAGLIEMPAGEEHKTLATAERDLARARGAGGDARRPPGRRRRRRRGRPRRLLRRDLPARHRGRAGPDDARRAGRLRVRRQDRGRPPRGARTTSAPTTSRPP